ncbi:MAG TPA: hypothetical protein VN776_15035 [Terracidiphilus sp.]|nr:hypothetical protein [Terracidiphilus sp.]
MAGFKTIREAKDYLAGKITEEAEREGMPLTEIERKMLYFTETGWTLPDMKEVSAEFDRDYDQDEYERKIGGLVRGIEARDDTRSEREKEAWDEAVLKLCDEDHYLLVLIDAAHSQECGRSSRWGRLGPWLPTLAGREPREPGDLKRLIFVALAFGAMLLIAIAVVSLVR